jgi:anti-anti-sigma factor
MTIQLRSVRVHEVPEQVTAIEERNFIRDLQEELDTERPKLVLDCSKVRSMDIATMRLLLSCLEAAMKRNGDVRLASLPQGAETSLKLAGVDRLFEMFATTADAIHSYHRRPASTLPQQANDGTNSDSEYAA